MAREMKDSGIEWIGLVPEKWIVCKQKYLISLINGRAYSDSEFETDGNYRILRVGNLFSNPLWYTSSLELEPEKYCSDGDLLYTWSMSYAPVIWHGEKVIFHYHIWKTKLSDLIEKKFAYYYFVALTDALMAEKHETTMSFVTMGVMNNSYIAYPHINEQRHIAGFLDIECTRIDSVIDRTRASIEEYKKLKQAVITQAVTKGIRPDRQMKDSGVDWLGLIPADWPVQRIANLYDERNESGSDELPILTVSINTGISDHEIDDDEKQRVFVRSEDKSKYKRVYPGDLAYNMMRAWQGAFGAVRTDGMISPAYVVAKPKGSSQLDSRYMEALLRTPSAIEEMHRYSYGITDFRLRLYWPEFKNICVCVPPIDEQREIANYIDEKNEQIDTLIAKKEDLLSSLESYKKSLIYEYVTGKKEVPA